MRDSTLLEAAMRLEETSIIEGVRFAPETAEEAALTTNVYAEIRKRLARRGVPPEKVAFIHDAKTPAQRAALFEAVNRGEIRVLIGSTEKMGTGMNAQERLLAVHQITPPWRPGDIEQQVGRMIRQGNHYPQVFQFVYVTEGSFDGYVWQLLENKAGFIDQIANGSVTAREVDDIAENVLTFSEIKALASGNPKILQKVVLDSELARLGAIHAAWRSAHMQAAWESDSQRSRIRELEETIPALEAAIGTRDANTPKKFLIHLKRHLHDESEEAFHDRETAGKQIRFLAEMALGNATAEPREIGRYKGFALYAAAVRSFGEPTAQVSFRVGRRIYPLGGESDAGVLMSLDARLRSLESDLAAAREQLHVARTKLVSLEEELGRPWEHEERYQALQTQVAELARELDAGGVKTELTEIVSEPGNSPDTTGEVRAAIEAIQALHADPDVLARFEVENPEPPVEISVEGLKKLEEEIEEKQALLAFGQAILQAIPKGENVQLDLFGGFASLPAVPAKRKGRR